MPGLAMLLFSVHSSPGHGAWKRISWTGGGSDVSILWPYGPGGLGTGRYRAQHGEMVQDISKTEVHGVLQPNHPRSAALPLSTVPSSSCSG